MTRNRVVGTGIKCWPGIGEGGLRGCERLLLRPWFGTTRSWSASVSPMANRYRLQVTWRIVGKSLLSKMAS